MKRKSKNSPVRVEQPALSAREVEVAMGIAEGKTYEEIGIDIGLGYETVRTYVNQLRDKTGRRRKAELAAWAATYREWLGSQHLAHRVAGS